MKLLHIDSSILGDHSVSRSVSAAIVNRLKAHDPSLDLTYRDLAVTPLSHLTGAYLAGQSPDVQHDQALQEDLSLGGAALAEFLASDIVVIGCPMYNFTIPSQLKAWIDRILVAGKTFHYTANGAEGLVPGKRVIIGAARGGKYSPGTPHAAFEHQETYLRTVFGFIGIKNVEFVRAEGIALGPEHREASLKAAVAEAATLHG